MQLPYSLWGYYQLNNILIVIGEQVISCLQLKYFPPMQQLNIIWNKNKFKKLQPNNVKTFV